MAAAWEPRSGGRWEVYSKPCPWSYPSPLGRGGVPSQPPGSQLSCVALTPFLTRPPPTLTRIAIVKLTPGERWLGMRCRENTYFILSFAISKGLGETNWLSTAKKRIRGRCGKRGRMFAGWGGRRGWWWQRTRCCLCLREV